MNKSVIIFGAGIAGLSAAHYLIDRGYSVTVIESLGTSGGLARSERVPQDNGMPSEYSWRGFGPWYHNTFSLMKEIPLFLSQADKKLPGSNVYDEELSNPINFILTPDKLEKYNHQRRNFESLFRISTLDKLKLGWISLSAVSACKQRSENDYALVNAKQVLDKYLSVEGAKTVSSVFGPWVGTDYTRASMHHVAAFFRRNIFPGPPAPYSHPYSNPPFEQGGWSGWLILRQPSNESWFDPWTRYLQERGVKFQFNTKLDRLCWDPDLNRISSAEIIYNNGSRSNIMGDYYVLAINPYITNDILMKTPDMVAVDKQLQLFSPLVSDSPHKQISFRIAFPEKIHLPGKETAVILVDSEYDITLFSQDQLWKDGTDLGNNVKSLWSGTATVDSVPGKLYGLPMKYLTREQFINEIKYQISRSKSLDHLVMIANNGRHLSSFPIERIEVWHSWIFPEQECSGAEIRDTYPKWVNNSHNFPYQPSAKTSIPNLFLAGAHTRTFADLYSMEAAVESGRRVADIISNRNTVLPQYMPPFLLLIQKIDCILYSMGLPNIIHLIPVILGIIIAYYILTFALKSRKN